MPLPPFPPLTDRSAPPRRDADAQEGRSRWLLVGLVVLAVVGPFAWLGVARMAAVADGTVTWPTAPLWTSAGVELEQVYGQPGALRPGDRVVAVDGVPLESLVGRGPDRMFDVGDRLQYTVERAGSAGLVEVPVILIQYPAGEVAADHIGLVPLAALMFAVASFVLVQRPRDRAARALFGLAAVIPFGLTEYAFATQVIDLANGPRVWPTIGGNVANALAWAALLHFVLVFPVARGILARRRWSIVAVYALPFVLHGGLLVVALPSAGSDLERLAYLVPVSVTAAHVVPFLIAGAMIWQYRATRERVMRRRLRWILVVVCGITLLYLGLGQVPDRLIGRPLVPWQWVGVIFLPFPLVLGAGVLRYQLFDIQVIVRRSLLYGTLTTLLVGLYVAVVTGLTQLLGSPTGAAPLIATALVAVLFQPLRAGLRRVIGKLVFGSRDDPYEVLTRLGGQLEAASPPDTVLDGAVSTVARILRLPFVAIELRGKDGSMAPAAAFGAPTGEPVRVALVYQGAEIGQLVLDAGPSREPFGPSDRQLLEALARQIAVTSHNVQLTRRLQRSLQQTVSAREEERRRLRRDIHDGVGPALAVGTMQLAMARRLVRRDPQAAEALLDTLAEGHQGLIADVRRLVEGLRPPVLDQLGLVAALNQRAGRFVTGADGAALRVSVVAEPDVEPLPAAVEVAAYNIVLESLTNIARHAGAATSTVRLSRDDRELLVEVRDDGIGLPMSNGAGIGLLSIRERATELGGTAEITSEPGCGTRVTARIPIIPV